MREGMDDDINREERQCNEYAELRLCGIEGSFCDRVSVASLASWHWRHSPVTGIFRYEETSPPYKLNLTT